MLKQFDTALIQASMTYSEYVIRSLLYLFREMLNLFIFFFFSWYLFFDILYVFRDFLSTSFLAVYFLDFPGILLFDILFSGFSWYLHFPYTSCTSRFCFILFYGFFFILISLFDCLFFPLWIIMIFYCFSFQISLLLF